MTTSASALLARSHRLAESRRHHGVRREVADLTRRFKLLFHELAAAARSEKQTVRGAEWLLDNDYIIQRALRLVRKSLPAHYVRQLPVIAESGAIRVKAVCDFALETGGTPIDIDWLKEALGQYQKIDALKTGELWALPAMLRLSVLGRLVQAAEGLVAAQADATDDMAGHVANEIASLVVSLRTLEQRNWLTFVEEVSLVEAILRKDPSGHYPLMEKSTRNQYRQKVEQLARWADRSEATIAQQALAIAERQPGVGRRRHVGYYLIDRGQLELEKATGARVPWSRRCARWLQDRASWLYPVGITALALGFTLLAINALRDAGAELWHIVVSALPLFIVASAVATALTNWCITQFTRPRVLPKLDFKRSVTLDCKAAVTMPVILGHPDDVPPLLAHMEMNYLGNSEPNLHYVLLTDVADADQEVEPIDAAICASVQRGIEALSAKHPEGRFVWLHRPRRWNAVAGKWMGWERKRGKLANFNKFVQRGNQEAFSESWGDVDELRGLHYVITLDADTLMPTGAAQRLLGTFSHPLNMAEFDPRSGRLTAGYSVIQPRVETSSASANRSAFARSYSGDTLLDLYSTAVSDVYHDVIGSGIFAGKAVYHVAALERTLANRVPDNAILSHDLFEGLHGRVGLATDIRVFEDFPPSIPAFMRRMHRWVRGDWQLLPWLFSRVPCADGARDKTGFSMIDRWKIGDNLRRSLQAPAIIALLVLGWLVLPVSAWWWTLALLGLIAMPLWLGLAAGILGIVHPATHTRRAMATTGWTARHELRRCLLELMLLPYEATTCADAILRTLWRLRWGRDKLLEWLPAAFADRKLGASLSLKTIVREMRATLLLIALVIALLVFSGDPRLLWVALPIVAAWLAAPFLMGRLSRVTPSVEREEMRAGDVITLRILARKTWSFFEAFVGPERHWLPPDNFHEEPREFVAERTSPTNIGLMLTSTLAAYDFGYLTAQGLAARLGHSLNTIEKLPRYHGHLLNWYHTRTLEPLEPRYVSTVDSGNLVGALLVIADGLRGAAQAPIIEQRLRDGFSDTVVVLREHLGGHDGGGEAGAQAACDDLLGALPVDASAVEWRAALGRAADTLLPALIEQVTSRVEQSGPLFSSEEVAGLRTDLGQVKHLLEGMIAYYDRLLPWLALTMDAPTSLNDAAREFVTTLSQPASLAALPDWSRERRAQLTRLRRPDADPDHWLDLIANALTAACAHATQALDELRTLRERCRRLAAETDFAILYDGSRHLFYIGYNVSAAEYDANHYDLLASEARLASYIAIAKRQVPVKHWLHLGRPFNRSGTRRVLVSWSATAFEYLMPRLFMFSPGRGVMDQSCDAAVARQARFGVQHHVPWGISESGFYELDEQSHYQYRAFGVPGLGLKREAEFRLVISAYSSLLALPYAARKVIDNLARIEALNGIGRYGAFEAIDFGAARKNKHPIGRVVRSYMSHHQGMILMAIANALHGDSMPRRFHSDRDMQRVEYLLYERLPPGVPGKLGYRSTGQPELLATSQEGLIDWEPGQAQQLNLLSNGALHAQISNHGAMRLTWREVLLSRGAVLAEPTQPSRRVYLHDVDRQRIWSPSGDEQHPDTRVKFAPHRVQFHHSEDGVRSRLDIVIAQDHDVEIQRLTLTNLGASERHIQALQYAEPVLCGAADDSRHPGFSKMFVEISKVTNSTLMFRRRPRGAHERPLYLAHAIVGADESALLCCTDRAEFLGRGGDYRRPIWFEHAMPGRVDVQPTLDPIAALGARLTLPPHKNVEIFWLTAIGRNRKRLLQTLHHYRQHQHANWAHWQARFASEREIRQLGLAPARVPYTMAVVTRLFALHADRHGDLGHTYDVQQNLWSRGISGDWPILLLNLRHASDADLARDAVLAHRYCSGRGVTADLVILDHVSAGYAQPTRDLLQRLADRANQNRGAGQPGRVILVGAGDLGGAASQAIAAAARVTLDSNNGPIDTQLRVPTEPQAPPRFVPMRSADATRPIIDEPLARPTDLLLDNGLGGFSPDGKEYVIHLAGGELPPQPWINVLANPQFGALVSASGAMFTWAGNSGEHRLTPWANDPVRDPSGEAIYLRDEETAKVWSPTPRPAPSAQPYRVEHGAGYTRFVHRTQGIEQSLTVHVDPERPVKFLTLKVRNLLSRPRRLTATFFVEWVLGTQREVDAPFIVSDCVPEHAVLLARNAFRRDARDATAFVTCSLPLHGMTADRREFLGPAGDMAEPAALGRIGLSGCLEAGVDPCAALQVHIDLASAEQTELHFVLGEAASRRAALDLARQVRKADAARESFAACTDYWQNALGGCEVKTPDTAFNLLLNRCLLYQAQACRLWARAALYQCGGGLGFRDQLQDVMALMPHQPELARAQIMDAARSQFVEGDVLHWWHVNPRRGVRTRCSDDLLWLPFVTAHYVDVTGDRDILHAEMPYLRAPPLGEAELERYAEFGHTLFSASLYEHCWRAIDHALGKMGAHGLPLIGTCDWNDGFSRVGVEGKGESVWLGWFLIATIKSFATICEHMDEGFRAAGYRKAAEDLARAIETHGWDGDWYRRAYYDDGSPLGAAENNECRIDLNAQSWSILSRAADPGRAEQAMASAICELVVPEHRLVLLLKPPFDKTTRDPGYIKGYPRGVRENGAQYTHAAIWGAWALADMGRHDDAAQLFDFLNPLLRCHNRDALETYRVEPYVMAADVYGAAPFEGRGGWTWYTGAAGWMHRLGLEQILGLRKHGSQLEINPRLPSRWREYQATWRHGKSVYRIDVRVGGNAAGVRRELYVDGTLTDGDRVTLVDDGEQHEVVLQLPEVTVQKPISKSASKTWHV